MNENPLYQAVLYLSRQCDGARTRDGAGWNKYDSEFGKLLSKMSFEIWSNQQKHSIWRAMSKYRKQLAEAGIDYEAIPIPIGSRARGSGGIRLKNNLIEIWFNYRADLVTDVKTIPGRRWNPDGKLWTVPASSAALSVAFARKHDFDVDEDLLAITDPDAVMADSEPITPIEDWTPIGRTITLETGWVAVRFDYNERVVESIKALQIAKWDKASKTWRVPYDADSLRKLWDWAPTYNFKGDFGGLEDRIRELVALKNQAIEASQAKDADIEIEGLGGELRPFQRAGVKYAAEKKRLIIADAMGLGKTIEALATVHYLDAFPCLIVCPASLKANWYREAHKWLPGKRFQMLGGDAFGRPGADVVIVNYDRLKDYREYLIKCGFKSIIGDESQYCKSPTAARTIYFEEICVGCLYGRRGARGQKADRKNKQAIGKEIPVRLLLTGTPVMNRPNELISQLQIIDRLQEFGGWYKFNSRYCGYMETQWGADNSGHGHLKELNELLRARCLVRRTKAEVLPEMPPKIRTVTPVDISNRSEYEKAEANLIQWLKDNYGAAKADAAERAEQLVRISALKQLAARGKMEAIGQWIADFLDTGESLVVYAWHKEIVRELAHRFKCHSITGDTPLSLRDEYVQEFQAKGSNLLVCNIQAGGVGLTLTAASDVLFCELAWNLSTMEQSEDRCHRIGQTDSVTAWWMVGKDTIDEMIADLIEQKAKIVMAATDGIEPTEDVGIMNALIDRLVKPQVLELTRDEG